MKSNVLRRPRAKRTVVGAALVATLSLAVMVTGATAAGYVDSAYTQSQAVVTDIPIPFQTGLAPARSVDTGLGVGTDHNVYVWGNTNTNKAGTDPGGSWDDVTLVGGLPQGEIVSASGGIYNFNALQQTGEVWGWGTYPDRDGTGYPQRTAGAPAKIRIGTAWNGSGEVLDDIAIISTTEQAGAGIRADGSVWAWGSQTYGGLAGNGANQVTGLPDPNVNDAEHFPLYINGGYQTFWVILNNGEVWYWGGASSTPTADVASTTSARMSTALRPWFKSEVATGDPYIVSIAGGINMGHAILSNGRVLTWGGAGRIANRPAGGTNPAAGAPGLVPAAQLSNIKKSSASFTGAVLLDGDGNMFGYGATDDYGNMPVTPALQDTSVEDITAGQGFYIWRKSDGTYWGQGYNPQGSIGTPAGAARRQITSVNLGTLG